LYIHPIEVRVKNETSLLARGDPGDRLYLDCRIRDWYSRADGKGASGAASGWSGQTHERAPLTNVEEDLRSRKINVTFKRYPGEA
jgi:hypothetical protein